MLGTAPHRLYRSPHVALARHQVPARGQKLRGLDAAPFVDRLWNTIAAIGQDSGPHYVPVAFDHSVRAAEFMGFRRVQGGVNAAEYDVSAAFPGYFSDFVTPQRVGGMDSDTDNIARLNRVRVHFVQSLI